MEGGARWQCLQQVRRASNTPNDGESARLAVALHEAPDTLGCHLHGGGSLGERLAVPAHCEGSNSQVVAVGAGIAEWSPHQHGARGATAGISNQAHEHQA